MRKQTLILKGLILLPFFMKAQTLTEKRLMAIEDKLAIKELLDTFSILADQKDTQKQTRCLQRTQRQKR